MPSSVSREAQNLALWAAGQAERAPEQPPAQNELTMLAQAMGQLAPPNARTTTVIQQSVAVQDPQTQMQFVDRISTDLVVLVIRATSARLRTLKEAALSLHRETSVFQCQELLGCAFPCHDSIAHLVDPQSLMLPTLLP